MNLDVFYNICRFIETQTSTKRADVTNLKNLNNSNCVKIKILLKELERNVPIDNCDDVFFAKIYNGLDRIINELTTVSRVHYTCVLLEKHSKAKLRKLRIKHQKRKEMRNKLKNRVEKYMASLIVGFQDKNIELKDLRDTFEAVRDEFSNYECKYLENAVVLGLKKESMETLAKEGEEQSDFDLDPNKQELQKILYIISLQSAQIDEDIAIRKTENQEIFQTYDHYMTIKFKMDEIQDNCNQLDTSLEEAEMEVNSGTEELSSEDYNEQIAKIDIDTRESAFDAEINKLNDLFQYLNETIHKVNLADNQAKVEVEQLRRAAFEAAAKTDRVDRDFQFWKSNQEDDDSDSELEELDDEIDTVRQRIAELKGSA